MGIEPKFKMSDVKARFDAFINVVEKRQIERLQYLGELCVTHARELPPEIGFNDQTGNLRGSIGYVVFNNGVAIHEGYEGTATGAAAGKALALKVAAKYKQGIALVVTAGMNYALAVESKGKDVLTSAESFAKQELPKMLNELKKNINQAMQ